MGFWDAWSLGVLPPLRGPKSKSVKLGTRWIRLGFSEQNLLVGG